MSARARSALVVGVAALVAAVATLAIWRQAGHLAGSYDWRYFQSAMEVARRSVAWFGEVPLYNPWMCGGEPQLANPQSIAGSPAFLFVVLFGTAVGEKLMLLAFVAAGLDGAYRLGRALGLEPVGAGATALCFALSGWVVLHFGIGHVSFFGATLIPHLVFFYVRARDDQRFTLAVGATMAIIVAQGGNSTAAMAALALGAAGLGDAIATRSARPLGLLLLSGIAAAALGAYRLFPALEFAIDHPRPVNQTDAQSPLDVLRTAFVWSPAGPFPGHRYAMHEYAWRLPFLAWPLVVGGVVALVRKPGPLRVAAAALVVLGLGIALGDGWPYGPWWVMRHLPVLRDLRVPSRYVLLLALGLALVAGAGLDALGRRFRVRWLGVAILVLLGTDGAIYANAQLGHVFALPPPKVAGGDFYQVRGHYSRMLELVYENRGVIGCDEEAPLTRASALDEGPGPQARLEDPSAGTVREVRWSPNALELEVETTAPATLLLNLNWNEHWKSPVGEVVRHGPKWPADKDGGRLAVKLPAWKGNLRLVYSPRSFVIGAVVSGLALLFVLVACLRRRR